MIRLFQRYFSTRTLVLFLTEGVLIFVTVLVAIKVTLGGIFVSGRHTIYFLDRALFFTVLCQLCLYFADLYESKVVWVGRPLYMRLLQAMACFAGLLGLTYYLIPSVILGRGIFALAVLLATLGVAAWRPGFQWMWRQRPVAANVLIVGTGEEARQIGGEVLRHPHLGYRVVGFVDDDPHIVGATILNPKVLGTYRVIPEVIKRENVSTVVVALADRRAKLPVQLLLNCKLDGVEVQEGTSFLENLTGKIPTESLRPSWLIFADGFRKSRLLLRVKRTVDLFSSLLGLLLATPLMALIAAAIRLDSSGPVLFRQERVGERGRVFRIFKFRSMRADAEAGGGPVWAAEDDPRVTRVGRWLRKLRLDELPQLVNVLRGEMSLVGPRPERPAFVEMLSHRIPYYAQRYTVKPGITGWAQIRFAYGASEEDALEKLQHDLYYIKNLSLVFDLSILASTVKVVLLGRGAR